MVDIAAAGKNIVALGDDLLYFLSDSTIVTCNTAPSNLVTTAVFTSIQPRANGELWCFGNNTGVPFRRFSLRDLHQLDTVALPPSYITGTLELRDGTLIGSTEINGVYICKGTTWEPIVGSPQEYQLKPMLEDRDGNVWFGGNGAKVWNPATNNWTSYTRENSPLTSSNVKDIVEDRNGNIIFGSDAYFSTDSTFVKGVYVKKGATWIKYDTATTHMPSADIMCMARDSTGNIWLASRYGIMKWDVNGTWEFMCKGPSDIHQPFGFMSAITIDAKNRVWAAAYHLGFFMLDQNGPLCSPKINILFPVSSFSVKQKTSFTITWDYEGPVGAVNVDYRNGSGGWVRIRDDVNNNRKFNWYVVAAIPPSTQYQIRISSLDNPAIFDTSARFTIADSSVNVPPSLQPLPDSLIVKKNQQTTLTLHATDSEKDTIKFSYSTLPAWIIAKDSVLTFNPAGSSATFTFTVTVSDGKGNATIDSVKVVVDPATGSGIVNPALHGLPPAITIVHSATVLSLAPAPSTTIRSAALYNLAGKKTGEFSETRGRFTLTRKPGGATTTVAILRVILADATENTTTISRVLLWQ